jgi:hypothetical protein
MFAFARSIFRHKVGVIAVLAFAVFMFSRDGGEEAAKPASPWSKQASFAAAPVKKDDSAIGSMAGKAVSAASDFIGETTGINPEEVTEQSVGGFDKANEAYAKANNR